MDIDIRGTTDLPCKLTLCIIRIHKWLNLAKRTVILSQTVAVMLMGRKLHRFTLIELRTILEQMDIPTVKHGIRSFRKDDVHSIHPKTEAVDHLLITEEYNQIYEVQQIEHRTFRPEVKEDLISHNPTGSITPTDGPQTLGQGGLVIQGCSRVCPWSIVSQGHALMNTTRYRDVTIETFVVFPQQPLVTLEVFTP